MSSLVSAVSLLVPSRPATIAALLAGLISFGYIVYFDYRRRHDLTFHRRLIKNQCDAKKMEEEYRKKRAQSNKGAASKYAKGSADSSSKYVELSYDTIPKIDDLINVAVPMSQKVCEDHFCYYLNKGDTLSHTDDPIVRCVAAAYFFLTLRLMPDTETMLGVIKKAAPLDIYKLVIGYLAQEYHYVRSMFLCGFPAKDMNVKLVENPSPSIYQMAPFGDLTENTPYLSCLISTRDFEPGDVIYEEEALCVAPTTQVGKINSSCSRCLKILENDAYHVLDGDKSETMQFCSAICKERALSAFFSVVALDSAASQANGPILRVVDDATASLAATNGGNANKAIATRMLIELKNASTTPSSAIAGELLTRLVCETSRMADPFFAEAREKDPMHGSRGFTISSYIERLRDLAKSGEKLREAETKADIGLHKDAEGVIKALSVGVNEINSVCNPKHFTSLISHTAFTAFAVPEITGDNDNTTTKMFSDKDGDLYRCAGEKNIGAALFPCSTFLEHACDGNAKAVVQVPATSGKMPSIKVVAVKKISKDSPISISYASENSNKDEHPKLLKKWGQTCNCSN